MVKKAAFLVVLNLSLVYGGQRTAVWRHDSGGKNARGGVTLSIKAMEVSGERLDLRYEIRNESEHEIWFCDDIDVSGPIDFETIATLDGQTLTIRMRLDLPMGWWRMRPPDGNYARLVPGKTHTASIWWGLPVRQQPVFASRSAHHPEEVKQARRLILEIGYFSGNLPERILKVVRDAKQAEQELQKEQERLWDKIGSVITEQQRLIKKAGAEMLTEEKEKLMEQVERLKTEEERLLNAESLLDQPTLHLKDLDVEITQQLVWAFEDVNSELRGDSDEISLPYGYSLEVESECLITATANNVTIPHAPPRYLDSEKRVPWGKEPKRRDEGR